MGTIVNKVNNIINTKEKIGELINISTPNIITKETLFANYPKQILKEYVNLINNGTDTLYNNFPKIENEGTELELNVEEGPMKVTLKGNTNQNTTIGKNKFNGLIEQGAINTQGADGTTNYDIRLRTIDRFFLPMGNYIFSCIEQNIEIILYYFEGETGDAYSRDTAWNTTLNFTLLQDCYIRIMFRKTDNSTILPTDITNSMIRLSSITDDTYEEYTGGIPSPNSNYPQNIKTVTGEQAIKIINKNLLKLATGTSSKANTTLTIDENDKINLKNTGTTTHGAYGIDNVLRTANYGDYISWKNQILYAGTYTLTYHYLSGTTTTTSAGSNFLRLTIYGRNFNSTDRLKTSVASIVLSSKTSSVTFTIEKDMEINTVLYLYTTGAGATIDINFQIQLEKNLIATDYIKHQEQNYPLSLSTIELLNTTNYKDYIFKNEENNIHYNSSLELDSWYYSNLFTKINSYNGETIVTEYISTTGGLDNGATIYYYNPSNSPIKITDTTLIQQLENINNNIKSYSNTTLIKCSSSMESNATIQAAIVALKKY